MFATPRAAEFFRVASLESQTGQPAGKFASVVIKELIDNALDASEGTESKPEVSLTVVADQAGDHVITVTDNGPGMSTELVDSMLDFSVLVSDKAAYRSLTRGLQGNAMKTIMGIPTALGCARPRVIESAGVRHVISAAVDPAGEPRIGIERTSVGDRGGTSVTVTLPPSSTAPEVASWWSRAFAVFNPHLQIDTYLGDSAHAEEVSSYKPTVGRAWRKPLPTDTTSPHWYDDPAFAGLVYSHINKNRVNGGDTPLGGFIRGFTGLTASPKAKEVCQRLGLIGSHLSDLDGNDELISQLLATMKDLSRPPKSTQLGRVPEAHYRAVFDDWYGICPERFWFNRVVTSDGNTPWVVEIAIAETEAPGDLFFTRSTTRPPSMTRWPVLI